MRLGKVNQDSKRLLHSSTPFNRRDAGVAPILVLCNLLSSSGLGSICLKSDFITRCGWTGIAQLCTGQLLLVLVLVLTLGPFKSYHFHVSRRRSPCCYFHQIPQVFLIISGPQSHLTGKVFFPSKKETSSTAVSPTFPLPGPNNLQHTLRPVQDPGLTSLKPIHCTAAACTSTSPNRWQEFPFAAAASRRMGTGERMVTA
jgi:hypothetical protein